MSNNKFILSSLAMDLKRVAIGYHRGSFKMAKRFYEEALKRRSELKKNTLPSYIKNILNDLDNLMIKPKHDRIAEDALMYSILIQNYTLYERP